MTSLNQRARARAIDPALLARETLRDRLREVLAPHRRDPGLQRIRRAFLGEMPLAALDQPLLHTPGPVAGEDRFRHPAQQPDTLYLPFLDPVAFPPPDAVSAALEAGRGAIDAEFRSVLGEMVASPSNRLARHGAWSTFPLMRAGRPIAGNIRKCPRTWEIVSRLPLLVGGSGAVYFSVMTPGTHIAPHFGPTNARWRYHLALQDADGARIRVHDEWRAWRTGECLILDDSFEHEVIHAGDRPRYILLVDAWRPELTDAERRFIVELYSRLRD